MLERIPGRRLYQSIPLIISTQVFLISSETQYEAVNEAANDALRAKVLALEERERSQSTEIARLRERLVSFEIEVKDGGQTRNLQFVEPIRGSQLEEVTPAPGETTAVPGETAAVVPPGEEGALVGGEGEVAGLGEEGESKEGEEEEEANPVDLTLAVSLLGYVTMVMTLFWMVSIPDPDMKYYVWGVLSNTLSIFLAVLMFTVVNQMCEKLLSKWDGAPWWASLAMTFVELVVIFTAMQISVAVISGSFHEKPFVDPPPGTKKEKDVEKWMEDQKRMKERWFKSVATLLAHMCGFAAINFGGVMQHLEFFQKSPPLTFLVPPALFLAQLFCCRMVRKVRTHMIKGIVVKHGLHPDRGHQLMSVMGDDKANEGVIQHESGIEWCVDKWDEETYESENEISALAISFLLLQACRYNLTGNMPNNMGIEEHDYMHPQSDVFCMFAIGLILAILCVLVVVMTSEVVASKVAPGTAKAMLRRMILVLQSSLAMGFAWALMVAFKWQSTLLPGLRTLNPNHVESRVLLALAVSFTAFFIILALDCIADLDFTGDKADKAIRRVIDALSILVGFTWEQSFDGAVEIIAENVFKGYTILGELGLTLFIFTIVYPQWRKQILKTMLDSKEKMEEHHAAEEAAGKPKKAPQATGSPEDKGYAALPPASEATYHGPSELSESPPPQGQRQGVCGTKACCTVL